MTYLCRICDTPFGTPNAAAECAENNHTRILPSHPVGMRFEVRCRADGCYLNLTPAFYGDISPAEFLAWAHESRFADVDRCDPHECNVKDLNAHSVSKPGAATGDKGGGNG